VVCEGHAGADTPYGKKGNQYVGKTFVDRLGFGGGVIDRHPVCCGRGYSELWFHDRHQLLDLGDASQSPRNSGSDESAP
jgi:hypothetical protein